MSCGCLNCDITLPTGLTGAQGPTGATGAAGSNGTNGASVLYNDTTEYTSSGTSLYTFATYTLPGATMADGDVIHIKARWTAASMDYPKNFYVYFNGANIAGYFINAYNENAAEVDVYLTRTSPTDGVYIAECKNFINSPISGTVWNYGIRYPLYSSVEPVAVANWTSGRDISIKGTAAFGGTIKCVLFQVTLYKKV